VNNFAEKAQFAIAGSASRRKRLNRSVPAVGREPEESGVRT
jgi:hypothetical protein